MLSLSEIAYRLGFEFNGTDKKVMTLLTDSRSLTDPADTIFIAIATEGNDGHRYIGQLYDCGVRAFIVSAEADSHEHYKDIYPQGVFFTVSDTVEALRCISRPSEQFHGQILAIAGSRGKTVLKEWIFRLMEPLCRVVRSPGSYNSQIGVPLSLWQISPDTDLGIIEAGISRPGEMGRLAEIIRPDTVIVTNVLDDHAEGFESDLQKAREKVSLALSGHTGKILYNADDPLLCRVVAELPDDISKIPWSGRDGSIPELPEHIAARQCAYDRDNAAAAMAFMRSAGIDDATIRQRFQELQEVETRLNVCDGVNNCSLFYDSFTNDCQSLQSALDFMRRRTPEGKPSVLILGELIHEVHTPEDEAYRKVAHLIEAGGISRFIGVGMSRYASLFPSGSLFFDSTRELLERLSTSDFVDESVLIKGMPEFEFKKILERLEARKHETVLEVNLDAIADNYNYFRSCLPKGTGLIAMVKASGYGAGSFEVARTMQEHGASYLAVAVPDEGIELRNRGISMPIMVMNPKVVNYKSLFAYRLEPEIYSMEMLRDVIREAAKNNVTQYPVHIKLDTGMHRMGFIEEELPEMMDVLACQDNVKVQSVFSHLATADCPDMDDYTLLQLQRFEKYTRYMLSRAPYPILRHVLNSAGIVRFPQYNYDMARLGIGLYGVNTLPPEIEKPLAPVSALRTVIIALRRWKSGESVGYARKGRLKRDSRIATIPIGYADGMNRHFGNGNIKVRLNGQWVPTIGNICMDACMIDVTDVPCSVGDYVEIFGPEAPLQRLADTLDTIPYEILTSVSPRVKRIYYRE